MVSVSVKISAEATTDRYPRHHGMTVDELLPQGDFHLKQPSTVIGVAGGRFDYETELDLKPGIHIIEYGNGGFCKVHSATRTTLAWKAMIQVGDNVEVSSPCVDRYSHLIVQFFLGPKGRVRSIPGLRKPLIPKLKLLTRIKGIFTHQRNQNLREGLKPR